MYNSKIYLYICAIHRGCLFVFLRKLAEIKPIEPETDNADAGMMT